MKPVTSETSDLKSHSMRSKLLSLHLILTILSSHMQVFTSPNVVIVSSSTNEAISFIQSVKQYLCLSLSRNAVSPVPQVFEISLEIFWKCMNQLRVHLKVSIQRTVFPVMKKKQWGRMVFLHIWSFLYVI